MCRWGERCCAYVLWAQKRWCRTIFATVTRGVIPGFHVIPDRGIGDAPDGVIVCYVCVYLDSSVVPHDTSSSGARVVLSSDLASWVAWAKLRLEVNKGE